LSNILQFPNKQQQPQNKEYLEYLAHQGVKLYCAANNQSILLESLGSKYFTTANKL
jgi:hypothetical protein